MDRKYDLYMITGATGYLGKVIINKLVNSGKKVRALVLPGDPAVKELPRGVELVPGRVDDITSLKDFFSGDIGRSCLIHCAGIISIASAPNPKLRSVNIEGTRNIIDMSMLCKPAKVVHVSTVHAIPEKPKGQVITEVREFRTKDVKGHYAKSKAEGTGYALNAALTGLDVSIVHPSGIIGPYDTGKGNITSTIISFCSRKLPAAVIGGYDFVDVRDVADGIIACCHYGRSGECYILSGRYATLKEILGYLSRSGYGREPVYLPLWAVRLISPFCELLSLIKHRPMFLTPYSAYTMGSNSLFSHAKASETLGYHPRDLYITLSDTAEWLREKGCIPDPRQS